jgi:hypothetical protein
MSLIIHLTVVLPTPSDISSGSVVVKTPFAPNNFSLTIGVYTVSYTAVDSTGSTTVNRTIYVRDTTRPVTYLIGLRDGHHLILCCCC